MPTLVMPNAFFLRPISSITESLILENTGPLEVRTVEILPEILPWTITYEGFQNRGTAIAGWLISWKILKIPLKFRWELGVSPWRNGNLLGLRWPWKLEKYGGSSSNLHRFLFCICCMAFLMFFSWCFNRMLSFGWEENYCMEFYIKPWFYMDYHFGFGICCTFLFKSILQNEWNLQKCVAEPQDCRYTIYSVFVLAALRNTMEIWQFSQIHGASKS